MQIGLEQKQEEESCVCVCLRVVEKMSRRPCTHKLHLYLFDTRHSKQTYKKKQKNKHTERYLLLPFSLKLHEEEFKSGKRSGVVLPPLRDGRTAIKIVAGGRLEEDVSVLYIYTIHRGANLFWSEYRCPFFL